MHGLSEGGQLLSMGKEGHMALAMGVKRSWMPMGAFANQVHGVFEGRRQRVHLFILGCSDLNNEATMRCCTEYGGAWCNVVLNAVAQCCTNTVEKVHAVLYI